jgi:hypothetical protein
MSEESPNRLETLAALVMGFICVPVLFIYLIGTVMELAGIFGVIIATISTIVMEIIIYNKAKEVIRE